LPCESDVSIAFYKLQLQLIPSIITLVV